MNADLISSSISTDGTAWVSSAILGERSYAATLFMNDRSALNREIDFSDDLQTQTQIRSSGPMGVYEFSGQTRTKTHPELLCLLADRVDNTTRTDEISTLGLWSGGEYDSSRYLSGGKTVSLIDINGTGMVSLNKGTDKINQTMRERSFTAGRMNISEAVEFGEVL